jgi:ankyrin repeat protein
MADDALEAEVRALLEAGADPNARNGGPYELPALFAVTGHRHAPRVARLLLEAGANPNDGESAFHAAERNHVEALELLLEFGVDLNDRGDWGNTPLYFLLRYWDVGRMEPVGRGLRWLLDHGADPNVACGQERESSLHVAARLGQAPEVVQLLLDHGADVHARRGDGRTPWLLATRGGHDAVAERLERAGAEPEPLSPADELMAACGRGDAEAAARLAGAEGDDGGAVGAGDRELVGAGDRELVGADDHAILPDAAARGRFDVVHACLAAGFPVDTPGDEGATALHHAALRGHAETVRDLLARGAATGIEDPVHHATPLAWAEFGRDEAIEPGGDYEACIRALATAG